MLKEYIRNKQGNPIGILLSDNYAGVIEFGYSLCNKKDTYNKEKGHLIALNRLHNPKWLDLPYSIDKQYNRFVERSKKYFKNAVVLEPQEEANGSGSRS
jgi:hypothetical protein